MKKHNQPMFKFGDHSWGPTSHPGAMKKVAYTSEQCESTITQIGKGQIPSGQSVEAHIHPTMEEYFYFLQGEGLITLEKESFEITLDSVVQVPANTSHAIKNTGESSLEFLFWGILTKHSER